MVPYSKRLIAANFQVGHLTHCTFNTNTLFTLFMNVETYFKKKAPPFYRRGLIFLLFIKSGEDCRPCKFVFILC